MAKTFAKAECVQVDPASGLVRVDGIVVFRAIPLPGNGIVLQFKDSNKARAQGRGTEFIEIPLQEFFEKLVEVIK